MKKNQKNKKEYPSKEINKIKWYLKELTSVWDGDLRNRRYWCKKCHCWMHYGADSHKCPKCENWVPCGGDPKLMTDKLEEMNPKPGVYTH